MNYECDSEICEVCGAVVAPQHLTENGCICCERSLHNTEAALVNDMFEEMADRSELCEEDVDVFSIQFKEA